MFSFLKSWLFDDDITSSLTTMDDSMSTESLFDNTGPMVNIDGSPMIGGIDIHGHSFGVTDTTSMFDDTTGIHSSIGCTDDMFSSSTTSSFDDPFSSGIGCGGSLFDD
jgi:hypothetical protein